MQRIHGLIIGVLFFAPLAAHSGPFPTDQKLKDFTDSVAKLDADIGDVKFEKDSDGKNVASGSGFLLLVGQCNPPVGKAEIIEKMGNSANPDSAKTLLVAHQKRVSDHVANAETAFGDIRRLKAACTAKDELSTQANAANQAVVDGLNADLAKYKVGIDAAVKQRSSLEKALKSRLADHLPFPSQFADRADGSVAACTAALEQIKLMDASNVQMQSKLELLRDNFSERIVLEQAAIDAPNSCLPVRKTSLSSDEVEFEPAPADELNILERDPDQQIAI